MLRYTKRAHRRRCSDHSVSDMDLGSFWSTFRQQFCGVSSSAENDLVAEDLIAAICLHTNAPAVMAEENPGNRLRLIVHANIDRLLDDAPQRLLGISPTSLWVPCTARHTSPISVSKDTIEFFSSQQKAPVP